jgi:hypothetical protein
MRIMLALSALALASMMALTGSRMSERTRAARAAGEEPRDLQAEGLSRSGRAGVSAMKGLDADYAGEIRRAKRALERAAAATRTTLALGFRRARDAAAPSRR